MATALMATSTVSHATTYRLILDGNGGSVWEGGVAPVSGFEDSPLIVDGCVVQPVEWVLTVNRVYNLADIAAPSLSTWQLRVKPSSIRAVKNAGTKIMIH